MTLERDTRVYSSLDRLIGYLEKKSFFDKFLVLINIDKLSIENMESLEDQKKFGNNRNFLKIASDN